MCIYISFLEPPTLLQARDDLAVRQHADVLLDDFLPASIKRLGVFGFLPIWLPGHFFNRSHLPERAASAESSSLGVGGLQVFRVDGLKV